MKRPISIAVLVLGLLVGALAFAQLIGLGVLRDGPGWAIALGSAMVLVLPVFALSSFGKHRIESVAAATLVWPVVLLVGLPVWFPGERAESLATGFGHLAAPLGAEETEAGAAMGDAIAEFMGAESLAGRPPAEAVEAEDVEEEARLSEAITAERRDPENLESIALPYEGRGRSLRIPVVFENDGVEQELWMLYDTGATYTTLTPDALNALGVAIPSDAPEITVATAGGERTAQIVLLDTVWLGGFPVDGVTIAVCEECGGDEEAGLLGLNVSGGFTVTIDPAVRELVLEPLPGPRDRHLDITHWLEIGATATGWSDGRVEVEVEADSETDRLITDVAVGIECADKTFTAEIAEVAPGAHAESRISLPRGTQCETYRIRLQQAYW